MTGQTAMITASGDWLDGDDVRVVRRPGLDFIKEKAAELMQIIKERGR
jgi:hypothetical protein